MIKEMKTMITMKIRITESQYNILVNKPKDVVFGRVNEAQKQTSEEFITKSQKVHQNSDGTPKYIYDKTNYVKSTIPVIITCPKHGDFKQTPNSHLNGRGCPKCVDKIMSIDKFIERSQKVHQNSDGTPKYIYDKTNYVKSTIPVIITCPKHGDFKQRPNDHLNGRGCQICGEEKRVKNFTKNSSIFIKNSQLVHRNPDGTPKYIYDKTNYVKAMEPVIITCPIHGDFKKRPNSHLNGQGCPVCGMSNRATNKSGMKKKYSPEEENEKIKNIINDVIIDGHFGKNHPDYGWFKGQQRHDKTGKFNEKYNEIQKIILELGIKKEWWGEKITKNILKGMGFNGVVNKHRYKECKNSISCRQYEFDVYLPYNEHNVNINKNIPETGIIFEYDGKQHFEFIPYFHKTEEKFNSQIHRDKEKNLYCRKNNIKLVRIPYTSKTKEDITQDIESALNDPSTFVLTGDYPKAGWNK